jgi:hypothetical protein
MNGDVREHLSDWVPIGWLADADFTPSLWRCRVCGEVTDQNPED